MAPEVSRREAYGFEIDWWQLGCLLVEMLTGRPPFAARDMDELAEAIERGPLPTLDCVFDAAADACRGLLRRDVETRFSHGDLRAHAAFRGVDWRAIEAKTATPPYVPDQNTDLLGRGSPTPDDDAFAGFAAFARGETPSLPTSSSCPASPRLEVDSRPPRPPPPARDTFSETCDALRRSAADLKPVRVRRPSSNRLGSLPRNRSLDCLSSLADEEEAAAVVKSKKRAYRSEGSRDAPGAIRPPTVDAPAGSAFRPVRSKPPVWLETSRSGFALQGPHKTAGMRRSRSRDELAERAAAVDDPSGMSFTSIPTLRKTTVFVFDSPSSVAPAGRRTRGAARGLARDRQSAKIEIAGVHPRESRDDAVARHRMKLSLSSRATTFAFTSRL